MKIALTALLAIYCFGLAGQEIDLVRLGYEETTLTSKQTGMAASPDGRYLAFAFEDKTVKIFDVVAGKFVKRFTGPADELFDLQITSDRTVLINKQNVQLWDWRTGKIVTVFG